MPLQIKPIPLAIVNFGYSGNPDASVRYFAKAAKVARMIDALHVGIAAGCKPRQLIELLAANHHNPTAARAFFTAVLSVKTPAHASAEVLADIDNRIEQAARDLSKKLRVPVVAWIHHNTQTRHAHLLFPNSDGRRTLPLVRKLLKEIQGFGWTTALASGRGKGRRMALPVYTKAKNLVARDLARQLVGPDGSIPNQQWDRLLATGVITAPRRRKDGGLISFECQERRIRVSTLEAFARELADNNNEQRKVPAPMIALVKPAAPLAPDVAGKIQDAGYKPDDFQALLDEFTSTRSAHRSARDRERQTQNQQPPTH